MAKWLDKIGVGGFAALVAFGGFGLWFWAFHTYKLVLRDDYSIWPTLQICFAVAVLFSVVALWLLKKLARRQKRDIGWYWTKGGKSHRRGGPLRWEDVIFAVGFGALFGVPGLGLWLNCALDLSDARTYNSSVLKTGASNNTKGGQSFYWWLRDWKNPQSNVKLSISREVFSSHQKGDAVVITTKNGALGYEWIVK